MYNITHAEYAIGKQNVDKIVSEIHVHNLVSFLTYEL